jgi:hypothetical protein
MRHNALSSHRVGEAIAAGMVTFYWIDGKSNPADIVSKHWAYPQVWHMLQPILFCSGDNKHLLKDSDPDSKNPSKEENKRDENGLVTKMSQLVLRLGMVMEVVKRNLCNNVVSTLHPYVL